ncbi:hypothetical protein OIU77_005477 [Salix suchowensis]|uniref:Uncharacterized protein n=1 Tax=Salix suchowensis TaxID=1278906 RepID=A0ABQ9AQP8_9ROSI|nr:hypothetical protein OIU77_005477 [Salix suchowensis]
MVSDVVPVACHAAADAGIRSVCVTNFSWDFIYAEYVMAAGNHHRSTVWQIAEDYSHCEFLIRLPGFCPRTFFGCSHQPHHCGQDVALSSIHAGVDRWGVAGDIRKTMAEARIRKVPACSLIDCI